MTNNFILIYFTTLNIYNSNKLIYIGVNLYAKYKELASKEDKVIFGGRLGEYKYYDMDKTIRSALNLVKTLD